MRVNGGGRGGSPLNLPDGYRIQVVEVGISDGTKIEIKSGVTVIVSGAFYNCNYVEEIIIPETVTTIEGGASLSFGWDLTSITFPKSLTKIDLSAFFNNNMEELIFKGSIPPEVVMSYDDETILYYLKKAETYVPFGSKEAYEAVPLFEGFNIIESEKEREIGQVLGNDTISISDALEILRYLAKLPSVIENDPAAFDAACILRNPNTEEEYKPTISDALEILKYLAKLDNKIDEARNNNAV